MSFAELLNPEHYVFRTSKSGSQDILIAFLNKTRAGDYEGEDAFADVSCHLLIVNSHRLPWHGAKLDGLLGMIPIAQAEISDFLAKLQPSKIVCFGFSLSGFPAIHMGAAFGADRIIALSPELVIGATGSRSEYHLRGKPTTFKNPDLLEYLKNYSVKDLRIIVGDNEPTDLYHAARMREIPGVSVYSIKRVAHQVFAYMRTKKVIASLLFENEKIVFGKNSRISWGKVLETSIPQLWFGGLTDLRMKRYAEAEDKLRAVMAQNPRNIIAESHLADALRYQSRARDALDILDRIAPKFPKKARIHRTRERLARMVERVDTRKSEAEKVSAGDNPRKR